MKKTFRKNVFICDDFSLNPKENELRRKYRKTFRKNVFICDDFSLNPKENELRRKYRVLGGSTEKIMHPTILEIEENGWFHWI